MIKSDPKLSWIDLLAGKLSIRDGHGVAIIHYQLIHPDSRHFPRAICWVANELILWSIGLECSRCHLLTSSQLCLRLTSATLFISLAIGCPKIPPLFHRTKLCKFWLHSRIKLQLCPSISQGVKPALYFDMAAFRNWSLQSTWLLLFVAAPKLSSIEASFQVHQGPRR